MDAVERVDLSAPARQSDAHDCGPALTTSLAWATWALFAGLGVLLVGVGLFATVIGVRAELNGFATWQIGLIGGAYYGGFLLGSKVALHLLARVGHIRVYAALASLLAPTMLLVGLVDSPAWWVVLRFVSGMCIAGQYVVAESWLNQLASNANRGRLLAVYMVITSGAFGLGQLLVGSVDPKLITGFAVAAVLTSLAVAPVALSEDAVAPAIQRAPRVSLRHLAEVVPTGVGTGFLVGVAHGSLLSLGAVFATRVGMSPAEAGRFIAATAVGGVLLQWPIASASDQLDRRFVGVVSALGAVGAGVILLIAGPFGFTGLAAMALLGGASFPLYSIAAAYTNDWVEPEHVSGAASQLILLYGAGALAGPPLLSVLMSVIGSSGYAWGVIGMHAAIVAFLVYRLFAWRAPLAKQPWSEASLATRAFFIPANAVWMGRRLSRRGRAR